MIENYIFDLYGTLVDIHTDESKPSLWKHLSLFLSLQGAAYAPKELQQAYHEAVCEQIDRCAILRPDVAKDHLEPDILLAFQALYMQKGVTPTRERLIDTALLFRTLSMEHLRLYPGVRDVLSTLKHRGMGVYLLSNAQAVFTVAELNKLGLTSCFDGVALSSDVGIKKPDEAIFKHILSKYALHPDRCLMIGNDDVADMWGAASVGVAGRYIRTKLSPEPQGPLPPGCQSIRSLRELL